MPHTHHTALFLGFLMGCGQGRGGLPVTFAIDEVIAVGFEGQLASGRFVDTNGDGAIDPRDEQQIWVGSGAGHEMVDVTGVLQVVLPGEQQGHGRVVNLDPSHPGAEYVTLSYPRDGLARWSSFGGSGLLDEVSVDRVEGDAEPWLADLRGDGTVQVVTSDSIRDARTGELVGRLEGVRPNDASDTQAVSGDLDLDGVQEIVAFHPGVGVRFYAPGGALLATCSQGGNDMRVRLAIGDLDGDPEGEVVVARRGVVEVCDSDGTRLARAPVDVRLPSLIGLGELDGDLAPEIVIAADGGLFILDDDLSVQFSLEPAPNSNGYANFSLVDLDGDGLHEILVGVSGKRHRLVALAGDGSEVASVEVPSYLTWNAQPIVADFDRDGLAEIAVATQSAVVIVEDGVIGGWDVPEASHVWSGANRFPGDRTASGEIPSGGPPHWSTAESNVWQGLPTVEHPHFGRRDR